MSSTSSFFPSLLSCSTFTSYSRTWPGVKCQVIKVKQVIQVVSNPLLDLLEVELPVLDGDLLLAHVQVIHHLHVSY